MSIFNSIKYREILLNQIDSRKKLNSKINFTSLASYLGVQKTLISKVVNGDANFNSDQIYLACEFLGFNEEETDYLHLLLEYDRCSYSKRKKILKERIQKIQREKQLPAKNLKAESVETSDVSLQQFYLDPVAQLIHAFLIIPKYAADPELIKTSLCLSTEKLKSSLDLLESIGFIKRMGDHSSVRVLRTQTVLSPTSPLYGVYHHLIRAHSLDRTMHLPQEKKYCFSALLSTNEEAQTEIRSLFLDFLKKTEKIVVHSKPEDVFQMNFDLFSWG